MKVLIYLCSILSASTDHKEIPLRTFIYITPDSVQTYIYPVGYRTWAIAEDRMSYYVSKERVNVSGYVYLSSGEDSCVLYVGEGRIIGVYNLCIYNERITESIEYKICEK